MGFDLNGRITFNEEELKEIFSKIVKEKYNIDLKQWSASFSFPSRRSVDPNTNELTEKYLLISLEKVND